jgi:hypothetical protein
VKGSPSNDEIADGSNTVETSVVLTGTASKGQKVDVLDGTVSKDQPIADPTTGIWTLTVSGLAVAEHRFTAKALYGSGQVSAERTLTVVAVIVPTLTNVQDDSGKEIPEAGATTSITLKLRGQASNGQQVEIFEGTYASAVSKGIATADPTTGIWERSITVEVGERRLYALSLYHSAPTYSNVRTLTVASGLIVDTSPLALSGLNFSIKDSGLNWVLTGIDPVGTTANRAASGGAPPFTYTSSDAQIASVDGNGVVRSLENGSTKITVSDTTGQSASFDVTVTNVKRLYRSASEIRFSGVATWFQSVSGASPIGIQHLRALDKFKPANEPDGDYGVYWCAAPIFTQSAILIQEIGWTILIDNSGWYIFAVCIR